MHHICIPGHGHSATPSRAHDKCNNAQRSTNKPVFSVRQLLPVCLDEFTHGGAVWDFGLVSWKPKTNMVWTTVWSCFVVMCRVFWVCWRMWKNYTYCQTSQDSTQKLQQKTVCKTVLSSNVTGQQSPIGFELPKNLRKCLQFLSRVSTRQHTDARYWYSKYVRLPVCPSVSP